MNTSNDKSILGNLALASLFAATIVGCGKPAATTTLSGRAAMGPISGSTVTAMTVNADGSEGQVLASTATDARGSFSMDIPPQPNPIELVISGGTYAEESGRATVNLGEQKVHAFVLKAESKVDAGVDAITEIAYRRAKQLVAEGKSANITIAIQAALTETAKVTGLADVTVSADDSDQPKDPHGNGGRKALFLCALSKRAVDQGRDSLKETAALSADFEDGVFDGKNQAASTITFSGGAGILGATELTLVGQEQASFAASSDNKGGLSAADAVTISLHP